MKRVAVVMALVVTVLALSMPNAVAAVAQEKPNMFPTMAACKAALESGNYRPYEPKYTGLRTKNPVNNVDRVVVPLESDICLEMLVVGGRKFVVQTENTLFRAHKRRDGSLSLYARHDCGNPVYGIDFPSPPVAEVGPEPEPAPVIAAPVYGPPPSVVERVVYREREYERSRGRKKWPWVLAALAAGGGYAAYYYWPCPPGTQRKW